MKKAEVEDPHMAERKWNTADFVGKYHLSKFKNHLTPLPGTQVAIEQNYDKDKEQYYKELEKTVQEKAKQSEDKLKIKLKSTEFRTKVFFDTVIGIPMQGSEDVLNEKERILNNKFIQLDDIKQINKFMNSMELNRSHYVSFAITCGYQSINYQEPTSGNTALHLAVRNGNVESVEELLKYKADPDIKNKLGNHPIHEAWLFWKTNSNRTKDERVAQEAKTCKMLLSILSYNGFPDSQDLKGQSALHIACRLGSVQAVKIILSFKADYLLCTKEGKSCQDIALEFGNEETYKLLDSWKLIRRHIVHLDFHVVWHKFLKDYQAIINSHKTAETILSELEMETNIKQLERDAKGGVSIEDALLTHAYGEFRLDTTSIPKPWEPGWAAYVKHQQAAGVVDLKSKLDALTRTVKGHKKLKPVRAVNHSLSDLPDRPTPIAKPRTLLLQQQSPTGNTVVSRSAVNSPNNGVRVEKSSSANTVIKPSGSTTAADSEEQEEDDSGDEEENGEIVDKYAVKKYQSGKHKLSSLSALDQRRRNLAHAFTLDAKFLKFTRRLCTNSALLIPLRDPQAPLNDTEEEGSIIRTIVSQGVDYDKFKKYKKNDKFAELVGIKYELPLSSIGAYSKPVDYTIPNERDLLYERLVNKELPNAAPTAAAEKQSAEALLIKTAADKANVLDAERREKIDLVNDKRPRYVNAELLPSTRTITLVEKMAAEKKERDAALRKQKQGLANDNAVAAARAQMEAAIAQSSQDAQKDSGAANNTNSGEQEFTSYSKRKQNEERGLAISNMFLRKEEVKYGKGRITSTHNTHGKLEEPWSTVGGRYKTVAGDRTA